MAFIVKDRVRETTTTIGTGTVTLGGAVTGFQSFSVIGNGNSTYYAIISPGDNTWEVGIGTYTASGTTLSRDTVLESSSNGALVPFQTGLKDVFCTYPAERSVYVSGGVITPATAATLPVASGGTAASTASGARTNLGLGTIATQAANSVAITGGSITGITDLAVADGGTGASDAATALTNLGAYPASNPSGYTTNTGTVTSVGGTGTVNGITLTGTVTTSGNLTLGGTLSGVDLSTQVTGTLNLTSQVTGTLPVANGGTGITSFGTGVATFLGTPSSANLAAAVTDETGSGALVFGTSPSLTTPTFSKAVLNDGYTEEVFAISDGASVSLDPNNGSIQTWTLGDNRTPDQANWAAGQSITLMVDDGTAYAITWSTLGVVWETNGGSAPTLATSGFTVIVLWKVSTTIYGARVGDA